MSDFIIPVIIGLVMYQAYVTIRVARSVSYTSAQKWRQYLLTWLLPFAGAAFVHAFLSSDKEIPVDSDKDFVSQASNDGGGAGSDGIAH